MKHGCSLAVVALLVLSGVAGPVRAQTSAPSPTPSVAAPLPADEAADAALKELEDMLARGEVGWWQSTADPTIQFLNRYTGLGSDTVTALSLNQMEKIWPTWKPVSEALEKFGIACSVYNCVKSVAGGSYNKAAIDAVKDFLKYKLSKLGTRGALYASSAGIIDVTLTIYGETAVGQIKDDYWYSYNAYQARRHRQLSQFVKLIVDGDEQGRGLDAIARSLDTFWADEGTAGIRGFHTFITQDPEYKATFRNRYLRENVQPFLVQWAEYERSKALAEAHLEATEFLETVRHTKFVVECAFYDRGLNTPARNLRARLTTQRTVNNEAQRVVLGEAPVAATVQFTVPLSALTDNTGHLAAYFTIELVQTGPAASASQLRPEKIELNTTRMSGPWRREAAPGEIRYRAREPFYLDRTSEVTVKLSGAAPGNITEVTLQSITPFAMASFGQMITYPAVQRIALSRNVGHAKADHGRYLVTALSGDHGVLAGPFTIDGPGEIAVEARPIGGDAIPATTALPDPERLGKAYEQVCTAAQNAKVALAATVRAALAGLGDFWEERARAFATRQQAQLALSARAQRELQGHAEDSPEARAIRAQYDPKLQTLQAERTAADGAVNQIVQRMSPRQRDTAQALETQRTALVNELNESGRAYRDKVDELEKIQTGLVEPIGQLTDLLGSDKLRQTPARDLKVLIEQTRKNYQAIEAALPALNAAAEAIAPVEARYRQAAAAVGEVEAADSDFVAPGQFTFGDQEANLRQQVDALRKTLLQDAAGYVHKAETIVAHRQARQERLKDLLRAVRETAAALPPPDEKLWADQTAGCKQRGEALFSTALAVAPADDTPALVALAAELDAFLGAQAAVCSDQRPESQRKPNAYSAFIDADQTVREFAEYQELPEGWYNEVQMTGWAKVNRRNRATGALLGLRHDLTLWLDCGATRVERRQKLESLRSAIAANPQITTTAGRLRALGEQSAVFEALPRRLVPGDILAAWRNARTALVRSGELETYLRSSGKPYLVFARWQNQPLEQALLWPEHMTATAKGASSVDAELRIAGTDEGSLCLVRQSVNGGRSWTYLPPKNGRWRVSLSFDPARKRADEELFEVTLPDGTRLDWPAWLPQYRAPVD